MINRYCFWFCHLKTSIQVKIYGIMKYLLRGQKQNIRLIRFNQFLFKQAVSEKPILE